MTNCLVTWTITPKHPTVFTSQESELQQAFHRCIQNFISRLQDFLDYKNYFEKESTIKTVWVSFTDYDFLSKNSSSNTIRLIFQHSCFQVWASFRTFYHPHVQLSTQTEGFHCECFLENNGFGVHWPAFTPLIVLNEIRVGKRESNTKWKSLETWKMSHELLQGFFEVLFHKRNKNIFEKLFMLAAERYVQLNWEIFHSECEKKRLRWLLQKIVLLKKDRKHFFFIMKTQVHPELMEWHLAPPFVNCKRGGMLFRELNEKYLP